MSLRLKAFVQTTQPISLKLGPPVGARTLHNCTSRTLAWTSTFSLERDHSSPRT